MPTTTPARKADPPLDPVYLHARRESFEILAAWGVAMIWTLGYCGLFGYDPGTGQIELVFGIPSWVFWGIAVPWLASSLFTIYFSLVRMKRDWLGDQPSAEGEQQAADRQA